MKSQERITALAQAKIDYYEPALRICQNFGVRAFASIVPQSAPRPKSIMLRKDYAYMFERFYHYLNNLPDRPMGYIVFDEQDKSSSHLLLTQVGEYFRKTLKGRIRSKVIIPEPLFVHSDLTTMVQVADIIAYIISLSVRLRSMNEPRRNELKLLEETVMELSYAHRFKSGLVNLSYKLIKDLRPKIEQ